MSRLSIPEQVEAEYLAELARKYSTSDGNGRVGALFRAIRFCGNQQIPMPDWVVQAIFAATNKWYSGPVNSLDDAFGAVTTTTKRRAQVRRKKIQHLRVFNAMSEWERRGKPETRAALVRHLTKKIGVSASVIDEWCYGERKRSTRQKR